MKFGFTSCIKHRYVLNASLTTLGFAIYYHRLTLAPHNWVLQAAI
jgi:hypothetical protein